MRRPKIMIFVSFNETLTQRLGTCYIMLVSFVNSVRLLIHPGCCFCEWVLSKFTDEAHSRSRLNVVPKPLTVRPLPTEISTNILSVFVIVRLSRGPGRVVEWLSCRIPNPRTTRLPSSRGIEPNATLLHF